MAGDGQATQNSGDPGSTAQVAQDRQAATTFAGAMRRAEARLRANPELAKGAPTETGPDYESDAANDNDEQETERHVQSEDPDQGQGQDEGQQGDKDGKAGKQRDEKREKLQALAKELGLVVDESRITPEERVQFRAERRQKFEALRQEQAKLKSEREDIAKGHAIQEAAAKRDVLRVLELAGFSQDDINEAQARSLNPEYVKQRDLERRLQQMEQEKAKSLEQQQLQAAAQEMDRRRRQHHAEMTAELKAASDPVLQAVAEAPGLVEQARAYIEREYLTSGESVGTAEALAAVIPQARQTYELLHRVFGSGARTPVNDNSEAAAGVRGTETNHETGASQEANQGSETAPATQSRKRGKHVSNSRAATASAQQPRQYDSPQDLAKAWGRKLAAAAREEYGD